MISVIIPVYNVEAYLKKCVDSVLQQTYSDIEVILVDDGSTDGSGAICDEYALQDARVKVIHKENGGLSDARNQGMEVSSGDVISFIDSDDYVSHLFLEILWEAMEKGDCDVAALKKCCDFWDGEDCAGLSEIKNVKNVEYCSSHEAVERMFYMDIETGAPFKLYKRHTLNNVKFPVGYYYEDVATTYKTFLNGNKAAIVDADIYAYRKRKDSICRQAFSEKKLSALKIFDEILDDRRIIEAGLLRAAKARVYAMLFSVFLQIPKSQGKIRKKVWQKLCSVRWEILFDKSVLARRKNKYAALVSLLGKGITSYLGRNFGQKGTMN